MDEAPSLGEQRCQAPCLNFPLKNEGWRIGSKLTGDLARGEGNTP